MGNVFAAARQSQRQAENRFHAKQEKARGREVKPKAKAATFAFKNVEFKVGGSSLPAKALEGALAPLGKKVYTASAEFIPAKERKPFNPFAYQSQKFDFDVGFFEPRKPELEGPPEPTMAQKYPQPRHMFDQFVDWVRRLSFAGFPLPVRVEAAQFYGDDECTVYAYMAVIDRLKPVSPDPKQWSAGGFAHQRDLGAYDPNKKDLNVRGPTFLRRGLTLQADLDHAKDQVIRLVRDLVIHELLEFAKVNGERVADPHTSKRPAWQPF